MLTDKDKGAEPRINLDPSKVLTLGGVPANTDLSSNASNKSLSCMVGEKPGSRID